MTLRTVAIVGAGLAGARAAETLRSEGFEGRIVLIGEEDVAPYERPALSKEFLAGARDEQSLLLRSASYWDRHDIELRLEQRVEFVDPMTSRLRTRRGVELEFDRLVLATGARPRRLPLSLPDGVHELRTLVDARSLRADLVPGSRLVVIGGGFVGAEVASTAALLGVEVTILEAAPAPVARALGTRVGLMLAQRWRDHGVDVRLAVAVAQVRSNASGRVASVLLTNGELLRADAVLVGVGIEPARELLPPRPAAHVLAAGDVVGPGHWTAAAIDGSAAARRILGLPAPTAQPPYVWSDQFGLRLQLVGQPGPEDDLEFDGGRDSFAVRYRRPDGSLTAALLANRPAEVAMIRRTLHADMLDLAA